MMKRFWIVLGLGFIVISLNLRAQHVVSDTIFFTAFSDSICLDEVVVKESRTTRNNSQWSDMKPVELVTIGGANGNLYQALQTLPGTQVQGESGKLLVRGGNSAETQTYIDGMHVLNPYTTTGVDTPARGRYSTFMFSGVNLVSGAPSQEYGEALSAVLPLETKDYSTINKLGVNPSIVGLGGGGTRAFPTGSLSLNFDFQNLAPYYRVFSSRIDFKRPYQFVSGATQFRYTPDEATVLKLYASYDRTDFSNYTSQDRHLFCMGEDNLYLNATFRKRTSGQWNWFAGASFSSYGQEVGGAVNGGDEWNMKRQELHLKVKVNKRWNDWLRCDAGVESFLRNYRNNYSFGNIQIGEAMHPAIQALFAAVSLAPVGNLKTELSFRTEYTSLNRKLNISPRLTIGYTLNKTLLSATLGRYTQLPESEYVFKQKNLVSETCWQVNLGVQYDNAGRFYKAECYNKKYDRLALYTPQGITSQGYGYSKGFDLFFKDESFIKNVEYQLAYSFNLSKRKYGEYAELTTPQYATRHNVAVVVKYAISKLNSIVSLTERYASGRPFHNPERPGLMNDEVKPFNSLDLGITWLISKKVILHASATNILNRKNEFGRTDGHSVQPSSDHFFYLGVFITLGKKAAYDVSNF